MNTTAAMAAEDAGKRSSFTDKIKADALVDQTGAILPNNANVYVIKSIATLPDFVVVAPLPVSTQSKGGVLLPTQSNDDCVAGLVIGKHHDYKEVNVGDTVVYSRKHTLMNIRSQYGVDYDLFVIRYNNIFTKLDAVETVII